MVVTSSAVHALDVEQRNRLEHLLVEFERSWHANRLAGCAAELPPDGALRVAALVELVKIDLERRWQSGQRPTAEEYTTRFPELLTADGVPFDLIQAELEAQRRTGTADVESFCRRFPGHSEALRELLSRTVQSNPVPPAQAELGTSDGGPSTVRSAPRGEPTGLPERFGRYLIRRRLGQGGMGAVFLAHDTELGRDVAVKVPQLAGDAAPDTLERFYREARAAAALRHPHLCPVYDVGQIDGTHFLTMAYVEGRTLADDIKTGPRPPSEAAALVRLLALALEFAHRHGVVHRDLKPANVLLNAAGEPAITDFGLARRVNQEDEPLTKAGAILGTPAYMSPEQVQGRNEDVGPASDVYSLGVILYELLTGQRPFRGTMTSVMIQIATEEPEFPSRLQQDLCPQLEEIVMRAMKKKIGDRYPSMGAFAVALGDYLAADTSGAEPVNRIAHLIPEPSPKPVERPAAARAAGTKRWLIVAGFLAAAVLTASVIVIVIKDKDGKVVGEHKVPEGGSFERKQLPDQKEGDKPLVPPVKPKDDPKVTVVPADMTFVLREPAKVVPPRLIKAHTDSLNGVAFSPDGKTLATGSDDKTICLWDVASGKRLSRWTHDAKVWCLAFLPDGKTLAAGGPDKKVTFWNVADGKKGATIDTGDIVALLAVTLDGLRLATITNDFGSSKHSVQVWDLKSQERVVKLSGDSGIVTAITFSPDGKLLAAAYSNSIVRLWDTASGTESDAFRGHEKGAMYAAFRSDGKALVTIGGDKTVRVWDIKTGNVQKPILEGHTRPGKMAWYTAEGRLIVSTTEGGGICLWDPAKNKPLVVREDTGSPRVVALGKPSYIALSPDGKTLAYKKGDDVELIDLGQYWEKRDDK